MASWASALQGNEIFGQVRAGGGLRFDPAPRPLGPLREMSETLLHLEQGRCPEWSTMRAMVTSRMAEDMLALLYLVEVATPCFDAFFSHFARAATIRVTA